MQDDRPLTLLDDVRQDTQRRRDALVTSASARRGVDVYRAVRAVVPGDVWGVDGVLDL